MEKELSRQFTEAYLNDDFSELGYEHFSEAIDNLPDGYVVFTTSDFVEIYHNIDNFAKNNKKLLTRDDWITLKEDSSIDMDDLNITIVK